MKTIAYNLTSVLVFMFIISSPLVMMNLGPEISLSKTENRKSVSLPSLPKSYQEIQNAKSQLESYLNDNFGFRDLLIQLANQIKLSIYKETTSKRVTIGRNSFLYMNSHKESTQNAMIRNVCNIDKPLEPNAVVTGFTDYFRYFDTLKLSASVAIIPTKSRVYPENLPDLERHWCQNLKTTWIDELLSDLNNTRIIYPINEFIEWKSIFPVYLPHRFHWEGQAPYEFSKLLLDRWEMDIINSPAVEHIIVPSDLANHLSGLHFEDSTKTYTYTAKENTCKSSQCISNFKSYYANGVAYTGQIESTHKKTLLMLSDSFGAGLDKHFLASFSFVSYA